MNILFKHRKTLITFFFILSILTGILIFNKLDDNSLKYIINNSNSLKYINYRIIIYHIALIGSSFILSFFILGILLLGVYVFFEGIAAGFIIAYFSAIYHLKGILYSMMYILIYKIPLIFLFIILIGKYLKINKSIISYIRKESVNITKTLVNILIISFLILLIDLFLLTFGYNMLNIFSFLTK